MFFKYSDKSIDIGEPYFLRNIFYFIGCSFKKVNGLTYTDFVYVFTKIYADFILKISLNIIAGKV